MKNLILFIAIFFTSYAFAKNCNYIHLDKGSIVNWTAYKTLKKVGVKGSFSKVQLKSKKSDSLKSLLKSAEFIIDARSVNTKNPTRDAIIAKWFFSTMKSGSVLTGKVVKVTNSKAHVLLKMNNVSREVFMNYSFKSNKLLLEADIDVLDFQMHSELKALGKACESKHEGKTWSEVKIQAIININKSCS